jgi:hypothetical protein
MLTENGRFSSESHTRDEETLPSSTFYVHIPLIRSVKKIEE